jgi:hypothetical protein
MVAAMLRPKRDVETAVPAFEGVEEGALPVPVGAVVLGPEPLTVVIFDDAAPEVFDGAAAEAAPVPVLVPVGPAGLPAPANCTGNAVLYCSVVCSASYQGSRMADAAWARTVKVMPPPPSTQVAVPSAPIVHTSWPVWPSCAMYQATSLGPTTYVAARHHSQRLHGARCVWKTDQ